MYPVRLIGVGQPRTRFTQKGNTLARSLCAQRVKNALVESP